MPNPHLEVGDEVSSPTSRVRYRVRRKLGEGGFGAAYLVDVRRGALRGLPTQACLKITTAISGWVSEAYFGYLLQGHSRAVAVLDLFAVPSVSTSCFGLVSEYAALGDLAHYLERRGKGWSEGRVRREAIGILNVLDVLHRGRALHRDLTPFNVFVTADEHLKLGDFGIAKHHRKDRGVWAQTMARWMAPPEIQDRRVCHWCAKDDVYQIGQLLAMLLKGDTERAFDWRDVKALRCSDHMKEIIQRCIGNRSKRVATAGELIRELESPVRRIVEGRVATLNAQAVVFTGALSIRRKDAESWATNAGATVQRRVCSTTTLVVRGKPSPVQKAGTRGNKLMDLEFWRRKGLRIQVIGEARFRALVDQSRSD